MGIDAFSSSEQGQEKQIVYRIFEKPIAWNYCGLRTINLDCGLHTINLDDPVDKMYGSGMGSDWCKELSSLAPCTRSVIKEGVEPVIRERVVEVPLLKIEETIETRIKPVIEERIHVIPKITYEEKIEFQDIHEYREVFIDRIVQMEPEIEYVEAEIEYLKQETPNIPKDSQDESGENYESTAPKDVGHHFAQTAAPTCPCCKREWHYYFEPMAAPSDPTTDNFQTLPDDDAHDTPTCRMDPTTDIFQTLPDDDPHDTPTCKPDPTTDIFQTLPNDDAHDTPTCKPAEVQQDDKE